MALKGMKHGKAMGADGIPVEVWKSLGEEGVDTLLDLLQKIFEQEKNARGMEGHDFANIKREWGHPELWELQRHQDDISYHDDFGKNNRQKTDGRDKHRRAVRFHAGQRDN